MNETQLYTETPVQPVTPAPVPPMEPREPASPMQPVTPMAPVQPVGAAPVEPMQPVSVAPATPVAPAPAPVAAPPVEEKPSIIKMYGEILTDKTFVTNPAIARDNEINQMILALVTPDKSALLVGKPGIGKTAIVET